MFQPHCHFFAHSHLFADAMKLRDVSFSGKRLKSEDCSQTFLMQNGLSLELMFLVAAVASWHCHQGACLKLDAQDRSPI
jgi:hypothetical protein